MSGASLARPVTHEPEVVKAYFAKVSSYEHDRLKALRRIAGVAWTVAIGFACTTGASSFVAVALATRPVPDPVVLRLDNTTGMVDRVYDVVGGPMLATEATERHFLWQFILAAEGYSPARDERQRNFDTVTLMSTADVQKLYAERVRGSNPLSPQVILGQSGQSSLSFVSTTFLGPKLAQVRYLQIDRKGDNVLPKRNMVATIAFDFAKGRISGTGLNVNPVGFLVTSYHVDREDVQ